MDYQKSAQAIFQAVGGNENINSLTHCMTRLRFKLNNESRVDDDKVKQIPGVVGINHQSGQYQIIIGNDVSEYYKELTKLTDFTKSNDSLTASTSKENWFNRFASFISSCMSPLIPALIGGGMIKVIVILLPMLGWMSEKSSTYAFLTIFGDAPFYFLPIMLAFT
ncbi:PTS beta-glucoside transporter subunit IIBCA, partial [Lactobacillus sp. XV13L]|nr:PTS beta-glucoside transporter subunit IIBCA [Lactobacillus sp. XV13L]